MAVSTFHDPVDGDPFAVADAALRRLKERVGEPHRLDEVARVEELAQHRYEFSLRGVLPGGIRPGCGLLQLVHPRSR